MNINTLLIIISITLTVPILLASSASLEVPQSWHRLAPPSQRNFTSRECLMCKFSISLINYALKTQKGADQVYRFSNSFCIIAHIESPIVCSSITKLFNHEIIKVLSNALITPDQICGYLSNNTCGHYNDPMADWEVDLDASISLNQDELEKLRQVHQMNLALINQQQTNYRVAHISDTHVDMLYKEGSTVNCQDPLCCRANSSQSIVDKQSKIEAGYWGSYGSCDVPLRTFESALKVINSTISTYGDVDYVIWTGDIQPHDVWDQNKKKAIDTYSAVFEKIFQYLPNIKIFPTFGNHEAIPVDSFSPSNLIEIARDDSPEWLYREMDSFWSRWLPSVTINTITKDGFYATLVRPGLKLISLNTNFCHNKNFWLYINATDPGNQLKWLIHELQISELEHEQVHIIGHIPPGTDDCLKVWSKNFNKIVRRFSKIITGQFYGHTHNNEFEIFYDRDSSSMPINGSDVIKGSDIFNYRNDSLPAPISLGLIGPSITTFIDLNPSFRIYTIDSRLGFTPINMETFYMNLTEANLGIEKEPKWESKLFSQEFGVTDIQPLTIHNLLLEMVDELKEVDVNQHPGKAIHQRPPRLSSLINSTVTNVLPNDDSNKFLKLFRLCHNYSDKYSKSTFDKWSLEEKKAFLCKFFSSSSHNVQACRQFISDNVNFNHISSII